MKFYFSPGVVTKYPLVVKETVEIVESRMKQGFLPWLLTAFKRQYDIENQFDLPILFVTEDDLGKEMNQVVWHNRKHDWSFYGLPLDESLQIPAEGRIPSPSDFDYRHYEFSPENELNANQQPVFVERLGSFDWLGIYYGFNAAYRRIFIRVDKILAQPLLNDAIGVASVVLHELAHALMDTKPTELKFATPVSRKNAITLDFYMEEAMANLIAYRAIRSPSLNRNKVEGIAYFMMLQPPPYALGVQMGLAENTRYKSLEFIFKSYVRVWYLAKCEHHHMAIKDLAGWVKLISKRTSFTDVDLKDQIQKLFTV